ncbi:hypothetical protein HHI36_015698 [Cryptolaemus montrouzieri]|uniref:DDE-1 domain-containing protein n=1 Tax=Cryptolaemus montrouzieri TaxID=559131 RepID=A0ABD2N6N1_9CUCU
MNQKLAYVNAYIFILWLTEHFLPRKGLGKALLIVDGSTSHYITEVLELAESNNKITRLQFGKLFTDAWSEAAAIDNPVSSFRATRIFPYNPQAIPKHVYSLSDAAKSSIDQPPDPPKLFNVVTEPMVEHLPDPRPSTPEPQPGP